MRVKAKTKKIAARLIALLLVLGAVTTASAYPYRGDYGRRGYYGYGYRGGYYVHPYRRGYVEPGWRGYPYGYGFAPRPYAYPPAPYYGYDYGPYYDAPVAPYYGLRGPNWGFTFTF
jgi:hypothetical protein